MVLILGENGYISQRFQRFFDYRCKTYKVLSMHNSAWWELNLLHSKYKFEVIINCIGFTGKPNVDACEDNKKECLVVNSIFAEKLADWCKEKDVKLVHVSSGCIYNSPWSYNKFMPYNEDSSPDFSFYNELDDCSWYSGTKALGESLVRKTWDKHYICRLRMPFNHIDEDKNYISKILKYPKVWSSPNSLTNVDEFVEACYRLYSKEAEYGTYNITNPGGISAKEILEIAKEYGLTKEKYEYFENMAEFSQYIKTPRSNCVLDTEKLRKANCDLMPVEDSLRRAFKVWNKKDATIFW